MPQRSSASVLRPAQYADCLANGEDGIVGAWECKGRLAALVDLDRPRWSTGFDYNCCSADCIALNGYRGIRQSQMGTCAACSQLSKHRGVPGTCAPQNPSTSVPTMPPFKAMAPLGTR